MLSCVVLTLETKHNIYLFMHNIYLQWHWPHWSSDTKVYWDNDLLPVNRNTDQHMQSKCFLLNRFQNCKPTKILTSELKAELEADKMLQFNKDIFLDHNEWKLYKSLLIYSKEPRHAQTQ